MLGRQLTQYTDRDIREIYERPYRLIFRVEGMHVDILTVMHYRQLLPSDFRGIDASRHD